jgi:Tfp pilus assembly protein PilF
LQLQESFAAARYQLGVVLLAAGDAAAAEASFVRTMQLEPRWTFVQVALGSAYHAQGRYKDAIDVFRKASEMDQSNSAAYAGLGFSRWAKGEKDGIKDIERAMKADPTAALPHLYLGMIYSQSKNKKDWTRAQEELKKAIQMNPQNMEFQNSAAERLLDELGKRKK